MTELADLLSQLEVYFDRVEPTLLHTTDTVVMVHPRPRQVDVVRLHGTDTHGTETDDRPEDPSVATGALRPLTPGHERQEIELLFDLRIYLPNLPLSQFLGIYETIRTSYPVYLQCFYQAREQTETKKKVV
jgi:hypothetical protein